MLVRYKCMLRFNHSGGVLVSLFSSSVVDHGFEHWSSQTNWYLLLLLLVRSAAVRRNLHGVCSESGYYFLSVLI